MCYWIFFMWTQAIKVKTIRTSFALDKWKMKCDLKLTTIITNTSKNLLVLNKSDQDDNTYLFRMESIASFLSIRRIDFKLDFKPWFDFNKNMWNQYLIDWKKKMKPIYSAFSGDERLLAMLVFKYRYTFDLNTNG